MADTLSLALRVLLPLVRPWQHEVHRHDQRVLKNPSLQLGASAANAFNHPNYAVPGNLTVGTSGFAQVTEVQTAEGAGPRSIQLTLALPSRS